MVMQNMRTYDYYLYGEANSYGQPVLSKEVQGTVKMAIHTTSQSVQENINYHSAQYLGLTHADISDKYVIQYGDKKLKVLYIQPKGRFKQIFMGEM
jgi:hypothetical protein